MATNTITPSRFEDGKALQLAGLQNYYQFSEMDKLPAQWTQLGPHFGAVPGYVDFTGYGAVDNENDGKGFRYFTGMEVSDTTQLPAGFVVKQVPAQKYAVFTYNGHISGIDKTIDAIFREWLPTSEHTTTNTPSFLEKYGDGFDVETSSGRIEFWVPVND